MDPNTCHSTKNFKGKQGRPFRTYPTYEEAKWLLKRRGFKSRNDYYNWYDRVKPEFVPKYAYRVYTDEWISWGDFLNTNNVFGYQWEINANAKPYWEAVRYIHPLQIKSQKEYIKRHKAGELIDVPYTPDTYYQEWTGWDHYLGKSVVSKLEGVDSKRPVWVVVNMPEDMGNVVWFLKVGSIEQVNEKMKSGWKLIKMYWYEEELESQAWEVVERNSAAQYDKEQRLCSNVNQLLWELSNILLIAQP